MAKTKIAVTLDSKLVQQLDALVTERRYASRSQAVETGSWIKISQIRILTVERLGRRLGQAPPEGVTRVVGGLNEIIGD